MNSFKGNSRLLICCTLAFVLSTVGWVTNDRAVAAENTVSCTDCHDDKQNTQYAHNPVAEGECTVCHEPEPVHLEEGGPGGMKTDRTASACYQCHDNMAAGSTVHPALEIEGECIQCHNPHGSSVEKLLVKPLISLCQECHEPVPAEAAAGSQHLAVTEGKGCLNCHNPHSGNQAALLNASLKTLCLGCHDQEITTWEGDEIESVKNIKEKLDLPYVHEPATEDDGCTTCHAPHGSKHQKLLTASFPGKNYYKPGTDPDEKIFELCFTCHDQAMLNKDISSTDTGFRNDTLQNGTVVRNNLHRFHVVNVVEGRSCNICHDPHGASQPHNLRSKWTMKTFEPTLLFESRPDGGECLKSCHRPKTYQRLD
ncbi:MAG: hypothetical protein K0A99_12160 [Desulfoarculaceae bacterium]|nr:hypothetical protein [Desulfoarculaceae bacterium]